MNAHLRRLPVLLALTLVAGAAAAQAQVTLSKSFSPTSIAPGSVSTATFTISNGGGGGARDIAFTDSLPAGMTVSVAPQTFTTCDGLVSASAGGSTIDYSGGSLVGGSSCSITVNVTVASAGSYLNTTGSLTWDSGSSAGASATLTASTNRPSFFKSFAPSSVAFGARSTVTLTIDNGANTNPASSITFTDSLALMAIASPANAASTCGGTLSAPVGGTLVSFSGGTVAAGASCTVKFDVVAGGIGSLANTTSNLTSFSPGSQTSGKAAAVLTVTPATISFVKEFIDDPVAAGGTGTLRFTITNLDRRGALTDLAFTDDLDAVLSGLVATSVPSTPCGPGSTLTGTSLLSLSGGNLDPEGSCTFDVPFLVPGGAAAGSYPNVTSNLTGNLDGSPVSTSGASDTLTVAAPSLTFSKEFIDDPVGAGGTVTLEFTITNNSESTATGIGFSDELSSVTQSGSTPGSGFCGAGSTSSLSPPSLNNALITVSGASLAGGASCTFSFTLNVIVAAPAGTYPNTTGNLTATVDGEPVTIAGASDDLVVAGTPILIKSFIDDPVAAGGTVTLQFRLVMSEEAPAPATDITFSDDLTSVISGLVATGLPASNVCGSGSTLSGTTTLLLTGGSLSPGDACTFNVSLSVPSTATPGPHVNTTSAVGATMFGVTAIGSAASDTLDIAGLVLSLSYIDDPALPGGTVTARYTLSNVTASLDATNISFSHNYNNTIPNLAATNLPLAGVCGGSAVGTSSNRNLNFSGGSLTAGSSCTFDVTLAIPAAASPGPHLSTTGLVTATVDGNQVTFAAASDGLTIVDDLLFFTKEFVDDPTPPGGTVTLRFAITNVSESLSIDSIAFTDDLDAVLSGLASTSGTIGGICGGASQISGTGLLTFTGGSLVAGATCTFDVSVAVPASATAGSLLLNTTSQITGLVGSTGVTGGTASDTLEIAAMAFSKSFSGTASAGGSVTLTFMISNLSSAIVDDIEFVDNLDAALSGLVANGLPVGGVCGAGSLVSGTSLISLTNGSLLPGGTCSIAVTLSVPASAAPGDYLNTTSELRVNGAPVADPATATLTVVETTDDDGDGVVNGNDLCPDTVIPEGVPTVRLNPNHYALIDGDNVFDTTPPPGGGQGPGDVFTTTDTGGCSCEQIIEALGLGEGHRKFGCSVGIMRAWTTNVINAMTLISASSFETGDLGTWIHVP